MKWNGRKEGGRISDSASKFKIYSKFFVFSFFSLSRLYREGNRAAAAYLSLALRRGSKRERHQSSNLKKIYVKSNPIGREEERGIHLKISPFPREILYGSRHFYGECLPTWAARKYQILLHTCMPGMVDISLENGNRHILHYNSNSQLIKYRLMESCLGGKSPNQSGFLPHPTPPATHTPPTTISGGLAAGRGALSACTCHLQAGASGGMVMAHTHTHL